MGGTRIGLVGALLAMLALPCMAQVPVWEYMTDGESATITRYNDFVNPVDHVIVPDMIDDLPVTRIGSSAFAFCQSMTSVTIPDCVTNIDFEAFAVCSTLTNAVIGNGVTTIDGKAFGNCYHLVSVTLGDSLTTIGYEAFEGCVELANVTFPDSGISIGEEAFDYCVSLTSINFGKGIVSIGTSAFSHCYSLDSVTIPDNVAFIGAGAFRYCTGLTTATIGKNIGTMCGAEFFYCDNLTGLYFRGNVPDEVFGGPFDYYSDTPVYFLPGSTGWESGYYFWRPAFAWNPQVQPDATFGVQAGCFGFTVTNAGSPTVVIEACTNVADNDWMPVATTTLLGGSSYFADPDTTNHPTRFYRFRLP